MSREQQILMKANQLNAEIQQLRNSAEYCKDQIYELADLYMDNRIFGDVGKEQKRLQKQAEKYLKQASKKEEELRKLRRTYGF